MTDHRPHGETTRDILALGQPHPAETHVNTDARESSLRQFGRRCRRAGITIGAGTPILAFSFALITQQGHFRGPATLFGVLTVASSMAFAGVLFAVGGAERVQRFQRAMTRQTLTTQDRILERQNHIDRAVVVITDQAAATAAAVSRLELAVAKVPGYAEGLEAGAQLLGNLMDPRETR